VLREYIGCNFGAIAVKRSHVHSALDGKRYALVHGDEYDHVTAYYRWFSVLDDVAYTTLGRTNRGLSWMRRKIGVRGH
jgi:UDP-2,3-diacylglucosamine pyrophosphatase LpxH